MLAESPGAHVRAGYSYTLVDLAKVLSDSGRHKEAEDSFHRAVVIEQQLVADFPNVVAYRSALVRHLLELGRLLEANNTGQEAALLYRQAWESLTEKAGIGVEPTRHWLDLVASTEEALVKLLRSSGRTQEIEAHYRQALSFWEKLAAQSPAGPNYRDELARTYSLLGDSLMTQKKYADAEPLLLAGYEGMKQREDMIPAPPKIHLTEALERLVQLYEAWGKKDQADEWRKKLPADKSAKPGETKEG
jgi:tetratricopeptide (TPR) repeat protein